MALLAAPLLTPYILGTVLVKYGWFNASAAVSLFVGSNCNSRSSKSQAEGGY